MKLLEGKKAAEDILERVKKEAKGKNLKLAVVLVGEDPASLIFVKEKGKACKKAGIGFELLKLPSEIEQTNLEKEIKGLAEREDVSGIVVQLPLPEKINVQGILNIIPLEKDADVLSQKSFDKFKVGDSLIIPPVVAAVECLLKEYKITLQGRKIALVGAGKLVGLPLAVWLAQKNIDFSLIDKSTENTKLILRQADVIISGVGKPGLIKSDMVKEGAVVIDAATILQGEELVGDVDFKNVSEKAGFITPVPGGIGPLTVVCLLKNLLKILENK
jgi:methylenetetrahydrofolate dehydrogenase (NADP+)/methenyltetrahydrofolate cyclohydrolase